MSITGDAEGKLHVRRQVEDYTLRGIEFEMMNFLNFTVETYERSMKGGAEHLEEREENETGRKRQAGYRYLPAHSKSGTHFRVCCTDNHNVLPNVVGPWFPRCDGEESTKSFYYASMLALLKPWCDLRALKDVDNDWETMFERFMQDAKQRDKDVVAGCQYYYESKDVAMDRAFDDERDENEAETDDENDEQELGDGNNEVESSDVTVSLEHVTVMNEFLKARNRHL